MSKRNSGGILLMALVAISVTTLLCTGLAIWLRPMAMLHSHRCATRDDSYNCLACIDDFASDILCNDTNGIDWLGESWHLPYESEDVPGASIKGELASGKSVFGATDEESRLPLSLAMEGPLEELIAIAAGLDDKASKSLAKEIRSLGPLVRREQLKLAPSMTKEIYDAIAPFITTDPIEKINVNTASPTVLKALFACAGKYDSTATVTLAAKIMARRASGGYFEDYTAGSISSELNGLTQAEVLLVSASSKFIGTESRYFSGSAESGDCRIVFTYDRTDRRLTKLVIARRVHRMD